MKRKRIPILYTLLPLLLLSCSQESPEPALNVADGGGTLSSHKAYRIEKVGSAALDIQGRIVFWSGNGGNTLLQIALDNTEEAISYKAELIAGTIEERKETLLTLDKIDGSTGAFRSGKFFVVSGSKLFDGLDTYDAHIIISEATESGNIVAMGNIGGNAAPISSAD